MIERNGCSSTLEILNVGQQRREHGCRIAVLALVVECLAQYVHQRLRSTRRRTVLVDQHDAHMKVVAVVHQHQELVVLVPQRLGDEVQSLPNGTRE